MPDMPGTSRLIKSNIAYLKEMLQVERMASVKLLVFQHFDYIIATRRYDHYKCSATKLNNDAFLMLP